MEIRYLEELQVLAREGRFAEAAERLYTTSSSLSKHIRILEKEFGVELLDRSGRSAVLNRYGEVVLPYAEKITALYREAQDALREYQLNARSTLRINTNYRVYEEVLEFREESGADVLIEEESLSTEALKRGSAEMAFVVNPDRADPSLVCIPYKRDRLVAVLSRDHPLAERDVIPVELLREENFVLFPQSDETEMVRMIYDIFQEAGFLPHTAMTARVGSTVVELVSQRVGISILWEKALRPILRENVTSVPLEPSKEADIDLCYRNGAVLSENAKRFMAFMERKKDLS